MKLLRILHFISVYAAVVSCQNGGYALPPATGTAMQAGSAGYANPMSYANVFVQQNNASLATPAAVPMSYDKPPVPVQPPQSSLIESGGYGVLPTEKTAVPSSYGYGGPVIVNKVEVHTTERATTPVPVKPSSASYGQAPIQSGYGQAPVQSGYGQAPVQGGYAQVSIQPPVENNVGQMPGYGQAPVQQTNYGQQILSQMSYGQAPVKINSMAGYNQPPATNAGYGLPVPPTRAAMLKTERTKMFKKQTAPPSFKPSPTTTTMAKTTTTTSTTTTTTPTTIPATSAATVATFCADNNEYCDYWASTALCDNEYVSKNCRKACKFCGEPLPTPPACTDNSEYCQAWKEQGECEKNPSYMHPNCAASCDKC